MLKGLDVLGLTGSREMCCHLMSSTTMLLWYSLMQPVAEALGTCTATCRASAALCCAVLCCVAEFVCVVSDAPAAFSSECPLPLHLLLGLSVKFLRSFSFSSMFSVCQCFRRDCLQEKRLSEWLLLCPLRSLLSVWIAWTLFSVPVFRNLRSLSFLKLGS